MLVCEGGKQTLGVQIASQGRGQRETGVWRMRGVFAATCRPVENCTAQMLLRTTET